jgi:hypothetical protein
MRFPHRFIVCAGLVAVCAVTLVAPQVVGQPAGGSASPTALMRSIVDDEDAGRSGREDGRCLRILGIEQCAQEERQVAESLVQTGPAGIEGRAPEKPSVVGFVRNGWPLVMEFEPEPGTLTILRVKLYHPRLFFPYLEVAYQQVLDPDGTGGRQTVVVNRLNLEGEPGAGDGVRVARYDIRSFRLVNGELLRHHLLPVRAPVTVFGFGAGPHSVGSPILRDVRFLVPGPISVPAQHATTPAPFTYALDRDYDAVSAELLRCTPICTGSGRINTNITRVRTPQALGAFWTISHSNRAANYQIVVRAWLQCGGASPAAALAQCRDDAAWAIGRSQKLQLVQ